jgi:hypothetical protein
MILALQCYDGDAAQALELTKLICDIETAMRKNDVFGISTQRGTSEKIIDKIVSLAEEKFNQVLVIRGERRGTGWPAGPNDQWAETMMRVSQAFKHNPTQTGVLTFEPDCVPLRADWIDALKAAWKQACQRGSKVVGGLHQEPYHINGNAIFRIGLLRDYDELNSSTGRQGWDMTHAKLLLSIGEDTDMIFQNYGLSDYDREYLENVRKNAVIPALFHGVKGPNAVRIVREMLNDGTLTKNAATPRGETRQIYEPSSATKDRDIY